MRKPTLEAGTSTPGCSAADGLPGERSFPPVLVEDADPFLGLGGWKDQLIAAEELHECGPVRSPLLPCLLDFPGLAA
ncbi:MAG: hypothetical protein ACREMY_10940 [bacterium]